MSGDEPPKLGDHFVLFFIGSARGQGALDLVKVFVTMDGPVVSLARGRLRRWQ